MSLRKLICRFVNKACLATRGTLKRRRTALRTGLLLASLEPLESRLVLYAASGNAWPTSEVITISFQPDGTNLGGVNSNLIQAFNSNTDLNGRWQAEILRAAQVWAQATNINFVVVSDNGTASGSGKYQQGDPGFGDIRIGGYDFGNTSLAGAYMPPPDNNYSLAGDIVFNTSTRYGIGKNYDLFTVAVHEFGHALGLDHTSSTSSAEMWATYNGSKPKLSADDTAGIRSIYSANAARSADQYDAAAVNDTISSATDITSELVRAKNSAVLSDLDLTTTADIDFYKVIAPKWTDDSMIVSVQSTGLSLLAPKLTIYAADQKTVLGTVSGLNQYGTTISVSVGNVVAGQTYYVKVEGADPSSFSVGTYGLIVDLGAKSSPTVTPPKTTKSNGKVLTSGGGAAEGNGAHDIIFAPTPVIAAISPDTGASSTDRTTSSSNIVLNGVGTIASNVEIFQNGVSLGKTLNLLGTWSFAVPGTLSDGSYTYTARGIGLLGQDLGVSDAFTVKIDTRAPDIPTLAPMTNPSAPDGMISRPWRLSGTSEASNLITLLDNGIVVATTTADGYGNWSYSIAGGIADGTHRFWVTATDLAGNTSLASDLQTLTVGQETLATSISYVTRTTSLLFSTLVVQGAAESGSTVRVFLNGSMLGTSIADVQGNWTYQYSPLLIPNGTYRFSAIAMDDTGEQIGLSNVYSLIIGSNAPVVSNVALATASINSSSGPVVSTPTPTITGIATKNTTVNIYDGNTFLGTVSVGVSGKWSFTTPVLSKGRHALVAVASDAVGSADGTGNFAFTTPVLSSGVHSLIAVPANAAGNGFSTAPLTFQV